MLTLQVIEGHNKVRIATVQKKGIRYRGQFHLPKSMERLNGGTTDPAGSLGGAALGALAFGTAGALVGSMVRRRGRTAVLIKTIDGCDLVCTVASDEFPGLYVEIQKLIALATRGYVLPKRPKLRIWCILLGPIYFMRHGLGRFTAAAAISIVTFGLAWLPLGVIAAYVDRRKRSRPVQPSADTALAPAGSEFIRTEVNFFPANEGSAAAPK